MSITITNSKVSYGPKSIVDGLVLYLDAANPDSYPGSGTIWYDLSESGYHMNSRNDVHTTWTAPGYWIFDGTTNNRQWYRDALIGIQNNMTIEAWISPDTYVGDMILLNQGAFYHTYPNERMSNYWYGKTNPGYHYTTANSVTPNIWTHTCSVWDSSGSGDLLQYINGTLNFTHTGDANGTGNNGTGELEIGAEYSSANSRQFNGYIAIIKVYINALSGVEVLQNYNALKSRFGH